MITTEEQSQIISELYDAMFPVLRAYAQRQLENDELADEAAQDAFRIACSKPDALINSPNPKGWLMETLKNVIRNMKRSLTRTKMYEIHLFDDVSEPTKCDDYFAVEYGDQEEFKMISLISEGKMGLVDVADELGISAPAVRKRMQRYREKFIRESKK